MENTVEVRTAKTLAAKNLGRAGELSGSEEIVYVDVRDGFLEIDDDGRVWRRRRRFYDRHQDRVLALDVPRRRAEHPSAGYLKVRRQWGGRIVVTGAHRLVWRHFRGELPDGLTINHINGDKADNRPENLELATVFEQREHCRTVLQRGPYRLSPADVAEIRAFRSLGMTARALAAKFSVSPSHAHSIIRGDAHAGNLQKAQ